MLARSTCFALIVVSLAVLSLALFSTFALAAVPEKNLQPPWDLAKLKQLPKATWGAKSGLVQEVWYDGEDFQGKPTRVFAWYARPARGDGPYPGMVLIHGGGGKAFAEWATLWAERGYAAIAMDTAGQGPDGKRHADAGPDQSAPAKFPKDSAELPADTFWTYHAVAAAIKAHSLLASRPEVDASRIGVTGISWGGYLTCIVAGLDDRFKAAVPIYGCGFLDDNSAWLNNFEHMNADDRTRWMAQFDPKMYLPQVKCPILFMNGTNDFAYPLDSYQKSYHLVPGPIELSVRVRMPHGHPSGWAPVEIGLFVDSIVKGTPALPRLSASQTTGNTATATFTAPLSVGEPMLHYTTDGGTWNKRLWKSVPAVLDGKTIRAELPKERPLVYYLSLTDERGALASTPHVELP